MKTVAIKQYLPIEEEESFVDIEMPLPEVSGHDLLVSIKAIAVNPVDTKVRAAKDGIENPPRVIGWDASGVVKAVGGDVSLFEVGDEVYYAGDLTRSGCNAEYQLVDERIVGRKPKTITHPEAAALPLTTITAYEALFDRLMIDRDGANAGQSILLIGAGGGVGSIGVQLAKLAGLTIIATASRPETTQWVMKLGAEYVVNHHDDMVKQVRALGFEYVDHIAIFNDMRHWETAVELIRPQGGIVTIDDTNLPMPMDGMKKKSASLHWEFMFARSSYQTSDIIEQHYLLDYVSRQIDMGNIKTTVNEIIRPINAINLRKAHALVEQGNVIGKVVLADWL